MFAVLAQRALGLSSLRLMKRGHAREPLTCYQYAQHFFDSRIFCRCCSLRASRAPGASAFLSMLLPPCESRAWGKRFFVDASTVYTDTSLNESPQGLEWDDFPMAKGMLLQLPPLRTARKLYASLLCYRKALFVSACFFLFVTTGRISGELSVYIV